MENFSHKDNWSRQKDFIVETMKIAQKYPLDKNRFEDVYYSKKEFTKSEQEQIRSDFSRASVMVETLVEYKFLLEELKHKQDWVLETLAHENAHANKGEELGALHEGYSITFIKKENGSIEHLPAAIVSAPENFNPEELKHLFVEVAKAPETYEGENNYLSDGDLHILENNKN